MTQAQLRPLAGRRVLDFSHVLAGPYATMMLADLGADVIKVERPSHGDETRGWGPPYIDGSSAYFHAVNRGKRSVALDLVSEEGKAAVRRLAASSDIVVENFRPGVPERLGIDYASLAEVNPQLIYASITGFGSVGPMAMMPGSEVVVEAYSGLMEITGEADGNPVRFGVAMVDLATGITAAAGILAALLDPAEAGGRKLEFSLYGTALSCLGTLIASTSAGDDGPARRWGTGHPTIVPYAAFRAADGEVVIGAINELMWKRLCAALELERAEQSAGWATNDGRVADRAGVDAEVARRLAGLPVAEVVARLEAAEVLVAPVESVETAARSEQARAIDIVFEQQGALFARSVLDTGVEPPEQAPALGEDTAEVLAELGL
ncbi:MAG TPA: CoA transferase [Solirubrobacterales bacterium]